MSLCYKQPAVPDVVISSSLWSTYQKAHQAQQYEKVLIKSIYKTSSALYLLASYFSEINLMEYELDKSMLEVFYLICSSLHGSELTMQSHVLESFMY